MSNLGKWKDCEDGLKMQKIYTYTFLYYWLNGINHIYILKDAVKININIQ